MSGLAFDDAELGCIELVFPESDGLGGAVSACGVDADLVCSSEAYLACGFDSGLACSSDSGCDVWGSSCSAIGGEVCPTKKARKERFGALGLGLGRVATFRRTYRDAVYRDCVRNGVSYDGDSRAIDGLKRIHASCLGAKFGQRIVRYLFRHLSGLRRPVDINRVARAYVDSEADP